MKHITAAEATALAWQHRKGIDSIIQSISEMITIQANGGGHQFTYPVADIPNIGEDMQSKIIDILQKRGFTINVTHTTIEIKWP